MSKQRPTLGERLKALQQGFFGKAPELSEADPVEATPMVVPIDSIKEYERNPRHEPNEAYEAIKASIQSRGFTGVLPITRRPGETQYMVAEGRNTVLRILRELFAETEDPKFQAIHCLFEPWKSESDTLIAHLLENDARGELLFIDRARAVHELRGLIAEENGASLSLRQLASVLRERGYHISVALLSRMEYAVEALLPAIPLALRSGMGRAQIERIRKLERTLQSFLEHRNYEDPLIAQARRWFFECLGCHDGEHFALDPLQRELEAHLAELCGESIARVRADFDLIEHDGVPGEDAPAPQPFILSEPRPRPQRSATASPSDATVDDAQPKGRVALDTRASEPEGSPDETFELGDDDVGDWTNGQLPEATKPGAREETLRPERLPQDVKNLRGRMWTLATQLAQHHGLDECILLCPKGCGFLLDLPEQPLFAGDAPEWGPKRRSRMRYQLGYRAFGLGLHPLAQ